MSAARLPRRCLGSNTAIQIFVIRAKRAGTDRLAYFLHESSGAYDLGQGWVTFGFVVWLLSFITGAGYLGPESGRLSKLAEERSPDDPEYLRRISRIFVVSRIELVALILVILDMAVKPGL